MKTFARETNMTHIKEILFCMSVGLAVASTAAAGDFDGSRDLLCVPTDAIQCEGAGNCNRVAVEEINLPRFVNVEFKKKQLRGTVLGGEEQTTAINSIQNTPGGRTILQGAQNDLGWSMTIDPATGDMSHAIAGDDIGYIMFGVCTAP
jgi:hypothetical protein